MQRRDFIMALGLAAVWPLAVQAQQPKKVPRIGYLTTGSSASQVAALWHPGAYGERTMNDMMKETEAAGLTLGLHLRFVAVQGPDELDQAFSTIAAERTDAVMVFPSPMLFTERRRIVDLAGKLRLPYGSNQRRGVVARPHGKMSRRPTKANVFGESGIGTG